MITWSRFDKPFTKRITSNFSKTEFECQCGKCDKQMISDILISKLESVRLEFCQPIHINSAYRCHDHQITISKSFETAKGVSQHELGNAVDIQVTPETSPILLPILEKYFDAIGIAKNFIHVDLRSDKKRRWNYGN